ncbi:MAG TPA: hypothetical protein VK604_24240 [Bryobacteraceae bacterium]|nr:hypothetical protein [Bryobacteraceae bacterium]
MNCELLEHPDWRWERERRGHIRARIDELHPRSRRSLVPIGTTLQQQIDQVAITGLPDTIQFAPGRLSINCRNMEHLAACQRSPRGLMDERLQQIFDSVPADEPRSRLDPYRELILRWRRQGKSHDRIRQLLSDKCGVKVAYGPLYRYIQRRSRPRHVQPEVEMEQPTMTPAEPPPSFSPGKRLSAEERAAQVEYVRSLNKPELPEPPKPPRFTFDQDKPRSNQKQQGEISDGKTASIVEIPGHDLKPTSRIVFTQGGEGGVGKTAFSTLLIEWYATQNAPLALIDMDSENKDPGSLGHFFPNVQKVNIQRARGPDDFVHVLDEGSPLVVADMGAGAGEVAHQ